MPDPPPNSPIDLRAHIRYDKYHRISAEKSYKNYEKLCEAMGKEAISIEEYESLYNQYLEEDDRDLPMPDVRGCILSDVICGKPAEKSIDDLCDAFKNHKIDKEDHDFWFKRFHNGHLSQVSFSDFPEDVLAEIVEKCDIKSYLNLRNVSSGLRAIVDQKAPPCTAIEVTCGDTWINVTVDDERIADDWNVLERLLRNPKLRLEDFKFHTVFDHEDFNQSTASVVNLLNSLNHKIHVKNCSILTEEAEDLIRILRCLKPGTLERMQILYGFTLSDIDDIAEMDQWKQAKHLYLRLYADSLPSMEQFLHFSTIYACFGSISVEDIVNFCVVCDSVSKWTNFEHIKIENQARMDTEEVERALNLQPTASPEVYSIPNSNLLIQFERSVIWNSQVLKIYKN